MIRNRVRAVASLGALAAMTIAAAAIPAATSLAGSEAPDFVLKSTSGTNERLSEYRGDVVMLTFWASWCSDCRAQLDQLTAMRSRYQDAGVALLAVSLDQNAKQAKQVAAALGADYPILSDPSGDVGKLYAVERVPVMVLIDRSGVVRNVFEGYRRGNEGAYLDRLQALLRE